MTSVGTTNDARDPPAAAATLKSVGEKRLGEREQWENEACKKAACSSFLLTKSVTLSLQRLRRFLFVHFALISISAVSL